MELVFTLALMAGGTEYTPTVTAAPIVRVEPAPRNPQGKGKRHRSQHKRGWFRRRVGARRPRGGNKASPGPLPIVLLGLGLLGVGGAARGSRRRKRKPQA